MPRRNRNPNAATVAEALADQAVALAADLHGIQLTLLCAACIRRPATTGGYCAPCQGAITRTTRRNTLTRR
jgi:hypothetical protein